MIRGLGVISIALVVFLSSCGQEAGSESGQSGPTPSPEASLADDLELFTQAGATEAEATCIAERFARNFPSDRELLPDDIAASIPDLAAGCAEEERLEAIASSVRRLLLEELEEVLGPLRERVADRFRFAGASDAQASCIADALLKAGPSEEGVYGTTREKAAKTVDLLKRHAADCAGPRRLEQVGRDSVLAPFEESLQAAGATRQEVDCFVTLVSELDLFFPSADFNGDRAAQLGADRIIEDMNGCIPSDRVRELVERVFTEYQKDCTRDRDDPMAPFTC